MDVNCYILFNKNNRVLSIISLLEADMEQKKTVQLKHIALLKTIYR